MTDPIVLERKPIVFTGSAAGLEKFFKLEHWKTQEQDGTQSDRIIWRRGQFVLIVAITNSGKVIFIREYKQAIEREIACLPAGAVKKDETPIDAALRELREETGYVGIPHNCQFFGPFLNSPDKSTEQHYVVLVEKAIQEGSSDTETGERIWGVDLYSQREAASRTNVGLHIMALHVALPNVSASRKEKDSRD